MTMIERVAGAIGDLMERTWASDRDLAHAAITAMREPTEEMLAAGVAKGGEIYVTDLVARWQAMIDTALNEDGSHDWS